MKARLVRIGNSRGVRIPKPLIEEARLLDEVDVRVLDGKIVICSARRLRDGWAQAAERARTAGDDQLLGDEAATRFDETEWKW